MQPNQNALPAPAAIEAAAANMNRTTITVKPCDTIAIHAIQTFLLKNNRKPATTSTLMRLALQLARLSIDTIPEQVLKTYAQILGSDARYIKYRRIPYDDYHHEPSSVTTGNAGNDSK